MILRALVYVKDGKFSILELSYNQQSEIVESVTYRVLGANELAQLLENNTLVNVEKANATYNIHGALRKYESCNNMVILARKLDKYIVHCNGKVVIESAEGIMTKALEIPLANGKIVTKGNKKYIVPLRGQYLQISEQKARRNNNESLHGFRSTEVYGEGTGETINKGRERVKHARTSSTGQLQDEPGINGGAVDKAGFLRRLKTIEYRRDIEPHKFKDYITRAKQANPFGAAVDAHNEEEYASMTNMIFDGGLAGVSVEKSGNITSLFKHPNSKLKGFAMDAIASAVHNGGDRCDCYSIKGGLPALYCRCGMIPVCKIRFNREFAPDNWDYEKNGEPDIVFMAYCGDTPETMLTKSRCAEYKAYDAYQNVPYISDSGTEDAYTLALKFRDNYIKQSKARDIKDKSTMAIIDKLYGMFNRQRGDNY